MVYFNILGKTLQYLYTGLFGSIIKSVDCVNLSFELEEFNMLKKLFYDCEIVNCIPNYDYNDPKYTYCNGWGDFQNMGIAVIGVYADWLGLYFAFENHRLPEFQRLVGEADEIIGFNSINFDDNLIRTNGIEIQTTYDLLCEIRVAAGMPPYFVKGVTRGGYSLGAIAETNLGTGKTGSGELAPKLWQDGKREEVKNYCLNDVKLLVELYKKRHALIDPTDTRVLLDLKD